jgi:hypothetical protein
VDISSDWCCVFVVSLFSLFIFNLNKNKISTSSWKASSLHLVKYFHFNNKQKIVVFICQRIV